MTQTQRERPGLYLAEHDGKPRADARRDVINAGLKALCIPPASAPIPRPKCTLTSGGIHSRLVMPEVD